MNNIIACGYEGKLFPININKKYENQKMMIEAMDSIEKFVARKEIKLVKKYNKPVIFISHTFSYSKLCRLFEKKKILIVKNPNSTAFVLRIFLNKSKNL